MRSPQTRESKLDRYHDIKGHKGRYDLRNIAQEEQGGNRDFDRQFGTSHGKEQRLATRSARKDKFSLPPRPSSCYRFAMASIDLSQLCFSILFGWACYWPLGWLCSWPTWWVGLGIAYFVITGLLFSRAFLRGDPGDLS